MSNQMTPEQFYKMAKRLNARLFSLEKLASNPTYSNVLNYAYKHAIRDIQAFNPVGKRFPTKMPENYQDYQKVVGAMRRFDKRPTSYKTAQKMIAVIERDANSILDAIKKGNNIIFTDEIYGERLNKFFGKREDVTDMLYRYLHRD